MHILSGEIMKRLIYNSLKSLMMIVLCLLLTPSVGPAAGQGGASIIVDELDGSGFSRMSMLVSVIDAGGHPIPNLSSPNFNLAEDGNPVFDLRSEPLYEYPLRVVLAVDNSNTMTYGPAPAPLASLKTELKDFANALPPDDALALLTYDEAAGMVLPPTQDRVNLEAALNRMEPANGSALHAALLQSAEQIASNPENLPGRPVVILIADSRDSSPNDRSLEQSLDAVLKSRAAFYAIVWGTGKIPAIQQTSDLTHGLYQALPGQYPTKADLHAALENVRNHLNSQRLRYTLTYTSNLPCDGAEHEVRVSVQHLGQNIQAIERFTAPECAIEISLSDIQAGQKVGGKVLIAPVFNRPEAIDNLEILVDNALLDQVASPPYEYTWDTTTVVNGLHTLSLVARDDDGNTNRLDVQLETIPPVSVTITNPANNAALSGPTLLSAEAASTTKVTLVEFLVDGKSVGKISDPPYEVKWDSSSIYEGTHKLTVRAEDMGGFTTEDTRSFSAGAPTGGGGGQGGVGFAVALVILASGAVLGLPLALRSRRRKKGGIRAAGAGLYLREITGVNPGREWMIPAAGDLTLGRKSDENDVPLAGASASRRHARINREGDMVMVYSLKADNPALINGVRHSEPVALHTGDRLQLGDSEFEVVGSK